MEFEADQTPARIGNEKISDAERLEKGKGITDSVLMPMSALGAVDWIEVQAYLMVALIIVSNCPSGLADNIIGLSDADEWMHELEEIMTERIELNQRQWNPIRQLEVDYS